MTKARKENDMMYVVNGCSIQKEKLEKITNAIIELFSNENITIAMANMILDETKEELKNIRQVKK